MRKLETRFGVLECSLISRAANRLPERGARKVTCRRAVNAIHEHEL